MAMAANFQPYGLVGNAEESKKSSKQLEMAPSRRIRALLGCFSRAKNKLKEKQQGIAGKRDEELEAEFRKDTDVARINYTSLLVKEDRVRVKDIPLRATSWDTKSRIQHWWHFFRFWHRKDDDDEEHHQPAPMATDSESDSEYEIKVTEQHWRKDFFAQLAILALAFSSSNLFGFPYDCYVYGGSLFLGVYIGLLLILMQPLIYMEMLIGQFSQTGVKGFAELHVYATGLPMAIVFMALVFVPYNDMVLGYSGAYALGATYTNSEDCESAWNELPNCIPYRLIQRVNSVLPPGTSVWYKNGSTTTGVLSSELYFRQYILSQRWDGHNINRFNGWNPKIFVGLSLAYIIVFLSTLDYLTSNFSRFIICTSILGPLGVVALIGSQLACDGSMTGLYDFIVPDLEHLYDYAFWADAFRHALSTLCVGYGIFARVSSKNAFNFDKLYRTSWMVCILTGLFSALSSLLVFTELGILKHASGANDYTKIFAEGSGISFIAVSGALMKLGRKWPTITFFVVFNIGGIWPQVVATETCVSYLVGWLPRTFKLRTMRRIALLIVISVQCLCAALTSRTGAYMLDSPQLFEGSWVASFVVLTEVYLVLFLYGFKLFMIDVEIMLKHSAPKLFQFQIRFICPLLLLAALVLLSIDNILEPTHAYLGTIPVPTWLVIVGYVLNLIPVLLVIGFGLNALRSSRRLRLVDKKNFRPGDEHVVKLVSRLRDRRGNIFEVFDKGEEVMEGLQMDAFNRRYIIQTDLKATLERVMRYRRAVGHWQRLFNKVLLAEGRVHTVRKFVDYTIREHEIVKNLKEAQYLSKVIESFSLDNVFLSSQLEDHGSTSQDYKHLLEGHLQAVSKTRLGFNYAPLTPFQVMVGKRNPTAEEDKRETIIRIKKHLNVPTHRDVAALAKIVHIQEALSHKASCFQEDPPLQFFFKHISQHLRVIMVKGEDHSLLRNLLRPTPLIIHTQAREIASQGSEAKVMAYVKSLIVQDQKVRGVSSFRSFINYIVSETSIHPAPSRSQTTRSRLEESRLMSPFPNWYYGADTRVYNILPEDTYVVVVADGADERRKSKFRWLSEPLRRKVWPDYTVEETEHGLCAVTYADLAYHQGLIDERERALAAPDDIEFRGYRWEEEPKEPNALLSCSEFDLSLSESRSSTSGSNSTDSTFSSYFASSSSSFSGSGSGSQVSGSDLDLGPGSRAESGTNLLTLSNPSLSGSDGSNPAIGPHSEVDFRYLQESVRARDIFPPKVHSETALHEAWVNVFGKRSKDKKPKPAPNPAENPRVKTKVDPEPVPDHDPNPEPNKPEITEEAGRRGKKRTRAAPKVRGRRRRALPDNNNISATESLVRLVPSEPAFRRFESESSVWSSDSAGGSSPTSLTELWINPGNSDSDLNKAYDSNYSLQAVWSQSSMKAMIGGPGNARRDSFFGPPSSQYAFSNKTKIQGWNECELYIYRPEGRMLIVEPRKGNDQVVVMADPKDSIASLFGKTTSGVFKTASSSASIRRTNSLERVVPSLKDLPTFLHYLHHK